MKILVQALGGMKKEEIEELEKELSSKIGIDVVIIPSRIILPTMRIIEDKI